MNNQEKVKTIIKDLVLAESFELAKKLFISQEIGTATDFYWFLDKIQSDLGKKIFENYDFELMRTFHKIETFQIETLIS